MVCVCQFACLMSECITPQLLRVGYNPASCEMTHHTCAAFGTPCPRATQAWYLCRPSLPPLLHLRRSRAIRPCPGQQPQVREHWQIRFGACTLERERLQIAKQQYNRVVMWPVPKAVPCRAALTMYVAGFAANGNTMQSACGACSNVSEAGAAISMARRSWRRWRRSRSCGRPAICTPRCGALPSLKKKCEITSGDGLRMLPSHACKVANTFSQSFAYSPGPQACALATGLTWG